MTIQDYIRKLEAQVIRLPEARLYALKGAAEEAHNGKNGIVSRIHDRRLAADSRIMRKYSKKSWKEDYQTGETMQYIELRKKYGRQVQSWDLEFTGTLRNELKVLHKRSEGSPFMFGGPNFVSQITTRKGPDGGVNVDKMTWAEGRIGLRSIFALSQKEKRIFRSTFAKLFANRLFRLK